MEISEYDFIDSLSNHCKMHAFSNNDAVMIS